jgi:hypothetical protein
MSKKSRKNKKKKWKLFKVKVKLLTEEVSKDGYKIEENESRTD